MVTVPYLGKNTNIFEKKLIGISTENQMSHIYAC